MYHCREFIDNFFWIFFLSCTWVKDFSLLTKFQPIGCKTSNADQLSTLLFTPIPFCFLISNRLFFSSTLSPTAIGGSCFCPHIPNLNGSYPPLELNGFCSHQCAIDLGWISSLDSPPSSPLLVKLGGGQDINRDARCESSVRAF